MILAADERLLCRILVHGVSQLCHAGCVDHFLQVVVDLVSSEEGLIARRRQESFHVASLARSHTMEPEAA